MQRKSKVIIFSILILVIALILIMQNKNIKQYFSLNSLGSKEVVHEDLYEPFLDEVSTSEKLIAELSNSHNTDSEEGAFGLEREKYIGFKDVNHDLTMDECRDKGYVVLDGIKIVENSNLMEEFIRGTDSGDTMRLRFAHFYDGLGPTYSDLVYDKGGYCYFYDDEENFTKVTYKYLLVLKGKWGNPVQEFRRVVVSDNKDITFDEVNKALVSSNMDYINSVGRFRIVLFDY